MHPSASRKLALLGLLVAWTSPLLAQRDLKVIPPPDPALEQETFILPEGFEVNLFAADPQIAKPIQMNFDARGRLWIASSSVYPQIEPGAEANDRILILNDEDGDGVSDSTKVFATGLLIPTGVEPGDGGAYVAASTELLHFVDFDGDDVADERRIVLSGFGTEDTHHILHTLRWGPEQRLYMSQSIYIHSHIETPWGIKRLNAGGIWQFRPETLELDVFARGWVNSWGTHFTKYGTTFATDGAGGEGINYAVPGASYATAYNAARILPGLNPGSPKHCGLEIVGSPNLPEEWQENFITNDFRGHRVCRFILEEDGSGFVSREQQELIKSNHQSFRPIDIKMGPDGAIYIADWYNPIIQHGEVDFRDPRRDHTHGRIWRVTYKGNKTTPREDLTKLSNAELLSRLASPNHWTRHMSKRVLKERGPEIESELKAWARSLDNTAEGYHQRRLEALWMYQAINVVEPELLYSLLDSKDASARAAATRIVGDWMNSLPQHLDWLRERVQDEHPRVRLEAVRSLAKSNNPEAVAIALTVLDQDMDQWLDYALWQTVRDLQPYWQSELHNGSLAVSQHPKQLLFLLKSAGSADGIPLLIDLLKTPDAVADADIPEVLETLVQFSRPQDLTSLLSFAMEQGTSAARSAQVLSVLKATAERRNLRPEGDLNRTAALLTHESPTVREWIIRCLGTWKVDSQRDAISAALLDESAPGHVRQGAIEATAAFKDEAAAKSLQELARNGDVEFGLRRTALSSLLGLRPKLAANLSVELMNDAKSSPATAQPLLQSFLARKDGPELLAEALNEKSIPSDTAVIALRLIGSSGQEHPQLAEAIRKAGKVTGDAVKLSPAEMQEFVALVAEKGDPARGEQVFRRASLNCLKCHAIGPAGGLVGPNMLSLGATAQLDYIAESLLDPNAKVKEGYNTLVVATDDGKVHSGIRVRETDDALILRDAENREVTIPKSSIEGQKDGTTLMPAGLTAALTQHELLDLTSFLSALGRLPDYTVSTTPVIRNWQFMVPTNEAAFHLRRTSYASAATEPNVFQWSPVITTVKGELPLGEIPEVSVRNRVQAGNRGVSFVRATLEGGGKTTLKLGDTTGLQAWVDGKPINLNAEVTVELEAGQHQLTFVIDRAERSTPLMVTH
ncbi:MAG: HEAT repeat domain-containing protein [Planctomycetaceae bacterium]|nr:HEAT repeat domain-containing protein [Planctomycetaceae bacterium]MCB9951499.1 HEAT repeat domain-containing protein [Planctomycetaceae bacterium]